MPSVRWNTADVEKKASAKPATPRTDPKPTQDTPAPVALPDEPATAPKRQNAQGQQGADFVQPPAPPGALPCHVSRYEPGDGTRRVVHPKVPVAWVEAFVAHCFAFVPPTPAQLHALQQAAAAAGVPNLTPKP